MGLDMYLYARKNFLDKDWYGDEEREIHRKIRDIIPDIFDSGNLGTIVVGFEVCYWRKANQIHNWFVENVQDGDDDCRDYYVSEEDLEELREDEVRWDRSDWRRRYFGCSS